MKLRWVSAGEIRAALSFPRLVEALRAAHSRPRIEIQDAHLGAEQQGYFVRHAVDGGRFMASKLITSFPGNPASRGLPAVQAILVLFDGADGRPLAVMDGTEITWWRTAADSALGMQLLAPPAPATLLVVGAGAMASGLVRAHCAVRPSLQRVMIWNRSPAGAVALAETLRREGIAAESTEDLGAACRAAEVISTCTRSHTPLVLGRHLRPGVHLDLVGSYSPQTREADDQALQRARIFVDRRESALDGVGDILQALASGAIQTSHILGDLYDLIGGAAVGRLADEDITLFKNAGGGHLDLMTAELVLRLIDRQD